MVKTEEGTRAKSPFRPVGHYQSPTTVAVASEEGAGAVLRRLVASIGSDHCPE